jgi:hypothetical protein
MGASVNNGAHSVKEEDSPPSKKVILYRCQTLHCYVLGKKSAADEMVERPADRSKHVYVAPWLFACLYSVRGEKQAALTHLKRSIEERNLYVVTNNLWPPQARLRGPEVDALLERAGLR